MGEHSNIEWTEATWNPVTGCSKVSPGWAHCYAETVALRFWPTQYASWLSGQREFCPKPESALYSFGGGCGIRTRETLLRFVAPEASDAVFKTAGFSHSPNPPLFFPLRSGRVLLYNCGLCHLSRPHINGFTAASPHVIFPEFFDPIGHYGTPPLSTSSLKRNVVVWVVFPPELNGSVRAFPGRCLQFFGSAQSIQHRQHRCLWILKVRQGDTDRFDLLSERLGRPPFANWRDGANGFSQPHRVLDILAAQHSQRRNGSAKLNDFLICFLEDLSGGSPPLHRPSEILFRLFKSGAVSRINHRLSIAEATIMPKNKPSTSPIVNEDTTNQWELAIHEAKNRLMPIARERRRLQKAIRLMRQQIAGGAPWPTPKTTPADSNSGGSVAKSTTRRLREASATDNAARRARGA